jgi:hypothetical protein
LYAEVVNNNWQPAPASLVEVIETKQIKLKCASLHVAEIKDLVAQWVFGWEGIEWGWWRKDCIANMAD